MEPGAAVAGPLLVTDRSAFVTTAFDVVEVLFPGLLSLVDCQITYHSRYLVGPLLAPVRDLVVLDPYNPRSVAFQVAALNVLD